jgi:hypothetical protein
MRGPEGPVGDIPVVASGVLVVRPFSTFPTAPPEPFTAVPEFSGTAAPVALPPPACANATTLDKANTVAKAIVRNCMACFLSMEEEERVAIPTR